MNTVYCFDYILQYTDRTNPMDKHVELMASLHNIVPAPVTAQMFGNAGREHMDKYGMTTAMSCKEVIFGRTCFHNGG